MTALDVCWDREYAAYIVDIYFFVSYNSNRDIFLEEELHDFRLYFHYYFLGMHLGLCNAVGDPKSRV